LESQLRLWKLGSDMPVFVQVEESGQPSFTMASQGYRTTELQVENVASPKSKVRISNRVAVFPAQFQSLVPKSCPVHLHCRPGTFELRLSADA
jgi:hypothetical protein